jgi:hypothetical protein
VPALIAAAGEMARIAADGALIADDQAKSRAPADGLRYAAARPVGFAFVRGVIRMVEAWPAHRLIVGRTNPFLKGLAQRHQRRAKLFHPDPV